MQEHNSRTTRRLNYRTIQLLFFPVLFLAGGIHASAQKAIDSSEALHLILWYRADTLHRTEFREYFRTEEAERLEIWKQIGLFRSYRVLSSSTFGNESWDIMLVITFNRFADLENWMGIEQAYPGGIDSAGLSLGKPIGAYICDLPFWGGDTAESESSRAESVFLVKPYGYEEKNTYMLFASAYVGPQFDAWVRHGTLRSYAIYTNREPTGPPWEVLIVLEYRSAETLEKRDAVKEGVGAELKQTPGWDLLNSIKLSIRGSDEERLTAHQIAP